MTYGNLKLRLTQAFPGVSLDLLEGWCNDRYQEILSELPWTRQNVRTVIQTRAPFRDGTVAVATGSDAITLTGGAWSSSMNGLAFRVQGDAYIYEFTYVDPTHATLDRPFDGSTAADTTYTISQFVYLLPSDCRLLADDALTSNLGPLKRFTHAQLDDIDPHRALIGTPQAWAMYMSNDDIPPLMQLEVWPIPDRVTSIPITYQSAAADLASEAAILHVWMDPSALVEGITARIKAHLKDYQGAAFHAGLAKAALAGMRAEEAQGMAPAQMRLSSYYTAYRSRRYNR